MSEFDFVGRQSVLSVPFPALVSFSFGPERFHYIGVKTTDDSCSCQWHLVEVVSVVDKFTSFWRSLFSGKVEKIKLSLCC